MLRPPTIRPPSSPPLIPQHPGRSTATQPPSTAPAERWASTPRPATGLRHAEDGIVRGPDRQARHHRHVHRRRRRTVLIKGEIRLTDSGAALTIRARQITVTPGTVLNTGSGMITLSASDERESGATASVLVTDATLAGGAIMLEAHARALGALVASSSAAVLVRDSRLLADGAVTLSVSSDARVLSATTDGSGGEVDAALMAASSSARAGINGGSVQTLGELAVLARNNASLAGKPPSRRRAHHRPRHLSLGGWDRRHRGRRHGGRRRHRDPRPRRCGWTAHRRDVELRGAFGLADRRPHPQPGPRPWRSGTREGKHRLRVTVALPRGVSPQRTAVMRPGETSG